MDFAPSRRVGTTYGKSTKRVTVHDLFDRRSGAEKAKKLTPPNLSLVHASYHDPGQYGTPVLDTATQKLNGRTLKTKTPSPNRSREPSTTEAKDGHVGSEKELDLFDIYSSEDEKQARGMDPSSRKRQKTVEPLRRSRVSSAKQATTLIGKSETVPVRIHKARQKDRHQPDTQKHNKIPEEIPTGRQANNKTTISQPPETKTKVSRRLKSRPAPSTRVLPDPPPQSFSGDVMLADGFASTDASDHLTDSPPQSMASGSDTPKRKRLESRSSGDDISSPSQLEIVSLRLTPERRAFSSRLSSPGFAIDDNQTPRRVRPRLVDRLDGPLQSEHAAPEHRRTDTHKAEEAKSPDTQRRARGRPRVQKENNSQPVSQPVLERSQSSQTRTTYATKARTTYAKERSHLSDMVDSLDMLDAPSSQQSSQNLLLQATTASLVSNLDFEDDESDGQPGTKILKSIHELRQAGATSRFDRESQALFEDIETPGRANTSSRLRALMKLIRRFSDEAFLRYFVSSGRTVRLTLCSTVLPDLACTILLTIALYMVSKAETSSDSLTSIFNSAVEMAPRILQTYTSLSETVRNPAEKLPKSTIKELIAFEMYLIERKSLPMSAEEQVRPDELILTCLDEVLRNMTRLGVHNARMSATCYSGIIDLLERHAQRLKARRNVPADRSVLTKALSLLEVCSVAFDNIEVEIQAEEYQILGESLAVIMRADPDGQEDLEQRILKAVVSLSNGKQKMCRLLGQSSITDAVFLTIDANFVTVADRAEHEQTLDQRKLDSVILALGCLLNFSECDGETRRRIAYSSREGETYLQRLVTIFDSQVDKAQEVTTSEQSQVLVAFGYLSMLLCTMSLDPEIRTQITNLLKDKSFDELCVAAETFFRHLRTLENISEDDASMSAFTARFSAILATIRSAAVVVG